MSDVLAVAEHREGELRTVSLEVIAAAVELSDGDAVHALIVGEGASDLAAELDRSGVDHVHVVDHDRPFDHGLVHAAACQLAAQVEPAYIVGPHSVNGMDTLPAVAESLDWPLVTDAIGLEADGGLTAVREMYGSKVETTVAVAGETAVISIRDGAWEAIDGDGSATIEPFEVDHDLAGGATVIGYEAMAAGDVDITEANVLVSVGRGIGEEENLELIEALADALGATIAASRPIVDAGWLPKNRQVGQSGKTVTPDVYIAIGISGAVQHVAGMQGADTIIAINNDPNAPIFDIADYGIVDDLFDVIPALTEALD